MTKMNGYLEYVSSADGWHDAFRLVDEGQEGKAGWMPLVMDDIKGLAGKFVRITVEELGKDGKPMEDIS